MKEKLLNKWTSLHLFILINFITLFLFLSINILTTLILKQSQSEQIYLENRNNILLTDYRSVQTSLELRVISDFPAIVMKNVDGEVLNKILNRAIKDVNNLNPLKYGKITYPIFYDDSQKNILGYIIFTYQRLTSFHYFFMVWLLLLICSIPIVTKLSKIINRKIKRDIEQQKMAAIGQTTSLLAHDVRRPFTMVKSIINMLEDIKDNPDEIKKAKEEVTKAIKNVEAMISDIMDYSREVKLDISPYPLKSIIINSIKHVIPSYKDSKINFIYNFNNKYQPLIDEERITRAFANIIGNAIEAITIIGKMDSGTITFSSQDILDSGKSYIEICIANSGPKFKEEDIPHLFDSFFTKGKKKGTGLGLASVQKIIKLHGGKVWAQNLSDGRGVQFIIRVQVSNEKEENDTVKRNLPISISQTLDIPERKKEIKNSLPIEISDQAIKILLLEDEALYRASVRNTITKNENLRKNVILYEAQKVEDAINLVRQEGIEFAIVDIDLAGEIKNGFNFLEEAQKLFPDLKSIVHSNRCMKEDHERAQKLGALNFVPKPLELDNLISLLSIKQNKNNIELNQPLNIVPQASTPTDPSFLYDFVYIEDDFYTRKDWEKHAKKATARLLALANPNEFAKYESSLSKENCEIYIDRELGDEFPKGEEVALTLHQKGFKKLYLATGHDADMFKHLAWLECRGKNSPWSTEEDDW